MNRRWLGELSGADFPTRVKHYIGLPPILAEGRDERIEMKSAAFVVIEQKPDGIFLYRYGNDGSYAGDTWHTTVEEAKEQVSFEYSSIHVTWDEVPSEVDDVVAYAFSRIMDAGREGERGRKSV